MNKRILKKQRRGPWTHHVFNVTATILDHPPHYPAFSQLLDDLITLTEARDTAYARPRRLGAGGGGHPVRSTDVPRRCEVDLVVASLDYQILRGRRTHAGDVDEGDRAAFEAMLRGYPGVTAWNVGPLVDERSA